MDKLIATDSLAVQSTMVCLQPLLRTVVPLPRRRRAPGIPLLLQFGQVHGAPRLYPRARLQHGAVTRTLRLLAVLADGGRARRCPALSAQSLRANPLFALRKVPPYSRWAGPQRQFPDAGVAPGSVL